MAIEFGADRLKLVREADGLEVDLRPLQGLWTEAQYLRLSDQTNRLVEFTDGVVEILSPPTDRHQVILLFLYDLFNAFIQVLGGKVLVAPLRLQIRPGKYREPDILLVLDASDPRRQNRFWLGADLVVEVVSPDNPERDTRDKRADYAEAGIPEYWIIDPAEETITVLTLAGHAYGEHGRFQRGATVTSVLLEGFAVSVDALLAAE